MVANLPLVARQSELSVVRGAVEAARGGHGEAVLITGEAGIGKTRLLDESRAVAVGQGMLALKGRAVESGGAYRPLVEAFARPATRFADEPTLAGIRPILARVLPGWAADESSFVPMADPAAVLAEALVMLLEAMAPSGAVVTFDDLHWADPDTLSVLVSLVDSVDQLPVTLIMAARDEPQLSIPVDRLGAARPVTRLPLRRLTSSEVRHALIASAVPQLPAEKIEQYVEVVGGLPLILDELLRQITAGDSTGTSYEAANSTLASATQTRLHSLSAEAREVLNAIAILGDADADLLSATTGLDETGITRGLHAGLASTLLVPAATAPLGVTWRHRLIGDAVRNLMLPLEQQLIAQRGADNLAARTDPGDAELHQAAVLYELAGHPQRAAEELVYAARVAVRHGALNVADEYLARAHTLTGQMPALAHDVLIERIETLRLAGRAREAFSSGMAALTSPDARDGRRLLTATARAAFTGGLEAEGVQLLHELEQRSETFDADLAALRAHAALVERRYSDAADLGKEAAARAVHERRFDLACEALVDTARAAWSLGSPDREKPLYQALDLTRQYDLTVWHVQILGELGISVLLNKTDTTRLEQARQRAETAGMAGTVAEMDVVLAQAAVFREGFVSTYPAFLRADGQARQLRMTSLYARTQAYLATCLAHADDHPIPGEPHPLTPATVDAMVANAIALGEKSRPVQWARGIPGIRAWARGDDATAVRLLEEGERYAHDAIKTRPWWGAIELVRVVHGTDPNEAFAPLELLGHHANRAAYRYGTALWQVRAGEAPTDALAEAEELLGNACFMRHLLRTIIAPTAHEAGIAAAEEWLREADAFCADHGERAVQRRARQGLAQIGARVPRSTGPVPPRLARLGITAREAEILRLINAGLGNAEIAAQLFISVRTVETHVGRMLQKTGARSREQLPSANRD